MRGGFFFREADGSIRGAASYQEFMLDPLPMRPTPSPSASGSPARRPPRQDSTSRGPATNMPPQGRAPRGAPAGPAAKKRKGRVGTTRIFPLDAPIEDSAGNLEAAQLGRSDAPQFVELNQDRSWLAVKLVIGLAIAVVLAGVGYQTRGSWLPQVEAQVGPVFSHDSEALSLSTADDNGELKIQWDRNSPAVRNALDGVLVIADGSPVPRSIPLDAAHLAAGAFTYKRESERVDVALTASEPNGQSVREVASFVGRLPGSPAQGGDPNLRQERDAQTKRADALQKSLNFQTSKVHRLEQELKDVLEQLQNARKRRTDVPSPDPPKQN
jgi:hypothetical protein